MTSPVSSRRALLCDSVLWVRIVRVSLHLLYSQRLDFGRNWNERIEGTQAKPKQKGQFRYSIFTDTDTITHHLMLYEGSKIRQFINVSFSRDPSAQICVRRTRVNFQARFPGGKSAFMAKLTLRQQIAFFPNSFGMFVPN